MEVVGAAGEGAKRDTEINIYASTPCLNVDSCGRDKIRDFRINTAVLSIYLSCIGIFPMRIFLIFFILIFFGGGY